ncbi:conserved hypothetical protein [Methylocella silvestris BL2]|uniref:DUF2865 domain-containing protein n=1 Tax=Methylocella silvestris (strain DSM 15510 / CIP 108128 / LMG 27833 / NCIMB 13906 / BL2) TaxID=395965 RepID=B8EMX9_METSB|nr:DUF2865 domain-containing protein [Methylocella silvestris]ACK49114.1 conserved hypothetical protein [Methylocella silvestris BL2]
MTDRFPFRGFFLRCFKDFWLPARRLSLAKATFAVALFALTLGSTDALTQTYDCAGLQAKIAEIDRGGGRPARGAGPSREQVANLNRIIGVARSLGCDRPEVAFSGAAGNRCPGLNAQIRDLQAAVGQAQSQGGPADRAAARVELVARFNTYCRNQPPRQRGFFEQLFGIPSAPETQPQPEMPGVPEEAHEEESRPHGGSQALCVRTCDGGFFPLNVSARGADSGQLTSLCQALCPNTTVAVYTRAPNREVESSVSLEGGLYSEMPNAGKFEKSFDPACTCKPPGQSWVDALAGADNVLNQQRKGDILVTPEKSAELSAPKAPARAGAPDAGSPQAAKSPGPAGAGGPEAYREVVGPDGVKRRVRIVGPTP